MLIIDRMSITIRKGRSSDLPIIHQLIIELAVFEKEPNAVQLTIKQLIADFQTSPPRFILFVAVNEEDTPIACTICYQRYSTWKGSSLFLEDLIVTESQRNKGIGSKLFEYCLNYAKANGYAQMNWQVLDWNTAAIDFYKKYGTYFDSSWENCSIAIKQ